VKEASLRMNRAGQAKGLTGRSDLIKKSRLQASRLFWLFIELRLVIYPALGRINPTDLRADLAFCQTYRPRFRTRLKSTKDIDNEITKNRYSII